MQSIIVITIYLMSILIPLIFTTINSELFEFPKFILLLSGSLVIAAAWALHIYKTRDFKIFLPTPISYGVISVLATQTIATIFSISPYTSFWGYYSRFHGGLLTTICYTIIYFAAAKWMDTKSTQKLIKISVITSILIGLYAVAERLGVDKNFWIQDVQNRPFATLGQPNWLAAYLLPNIFLTLYLSLTSKLKKPSTISLFTFAVLFFALLLTKSRSGFLAFVFSYITYWLLLLRQFKFGNIKYYLVNLSLTILAISLLLGTPYSPTLTSMFSAGSPDNRNTGTQPTGTALENGGTESGDIRKIVWTGALKLIGKHPLLGTGPETFAYTYYWERPVAHNMTSEWDFLYNKAHNEYLNIAAGAGLIGLITYLYFHYAVLASSLTIIPKSKKIDQDRDNSLRYLYPVLGASIVGFTITNFFGFSVIPVYFMMIVVAAMPSTLTNTLTSTKTFNLQPLIFILLVFVYPIRLFYADYLYATGKATSSIDLLTKAVAARPGLDLYHAQLGEIYAVTGQKELSLQELERSRQLNPYHLNFYKSRAKIYLTLAALDPSYNLQAAKELEAARKLAPTDPKLAYNLGLIYTRIDKADLAIKQLQDAIALKSNYQEPYYALTLLYEQTKQVDKIPPLLQSASTNLATYSAQLKEKMDKYKSDK